MYSLALRRERHIPLRVRPVARAEKEIVGIGSWSPNRSTHGDTTAYLYVNEDHPSSDSAISYILESSINVWQLRTTVAD